ncbi:hypothetical protein DL89DRAFT_162672 [Linderina pennispora]|uniref:Secreted protein n=1 Tax=Linderina pennispora TaxID=61395 RepID=A0A1Y1W885_9FUNG|nr:uncharacterized protein DL89DRAFT_162672 [Linderina pennispora]ORX69548.1 hypothetical protein DL89DRAFT_162672 [Linderina pennispora]
MRDLLASRKGPAALLLLLLIASFCRSLHRPRNFLFTIVYSECSRVLRQQQQQPEREARDDFLFTIACILLPNCGRPYLPKGKSTRPIICL